MLRNLLEFFLAILGVLITGILFFRIPRLAKKPEGVSAIRLSVIIPCRNEEANLGRLLQDLSRQSVTPWEIICVDDDSSDATAEIAQSYGVKVITTRDKPDGWIGKSWACHVGVTQASGDDFLFLDADVKLGHQALERLISTYQVNESPLSVQPFHRTEKLYEQGSFIFNLIQIAANGTAMPRPLNVGLYGPVILISRGDYQSIGGHASVRGHIVEDMALGRRLKEKAIPYRLYIGDEEIAFRMYPSGLQGLFQGWAKNVLEGVAETPKILLGLVFLWMSSLISAPLHLITFVHSKAWTWFGLYLILYLVWVAILLVLARKIGRYMTGLIIFYPIHLVAYLTIMLISLLKRLLGISVVWKDRPIGEED